MEQLEEMSTAERVARYVERRPYVRYALAAGIVNFSALARRVQEDIDGGFEAIKVALRRQAEELATSMREDREDVATVLEGSTVSITGGLQVCKLDERPEPEDTPMVMARTEHGWTVVTPAEQAFVGEVIPGQALVTVTSPQSLEETPGVLGYLLALLGAHGINATEVVSCREDTHIVVDQDDATAAFDLLSSRIS